MIAPYTIKILITGFLLALLLPTTDVRGQEIEFSLDTISINQTLSSAQNQRNITLEKTNKYLHPYDGARPNIQDILQHQFYDNYDGAYRSAQEEVVHSILNLHNDSNTPKSIILNFGNQRIHKLLAYDQSVDAINLIGITGQHLLDLHNRTYRSNQLAIALELEPYQMLPLHLLHQTTLYADDINLQLWEQQDFAESNTKAHIANGVYFGFIAFMIIIVMILGGLFRDRKYWLYALYMFAFLLFMLQYTGYLDLLILPTIYTYVMDPRIIFSAGAIICFIHFLNNVIELNKYTIPHGIQIIYALLILVLTVGITAMSYRDQYTIIGELNNYLSIISIAIVAGIITIGIVRSATKYPTECAVILFSISSILLAYIISVLIEAGILPDLNFPISLLQIGLLAELMAITCYLAINVRNVSIREQLALQQSSEAQLELAQTLYQTRISERNNIHNFLKEDIIPNFELLKNSDSNHDDLYTKILNDTDKRLSSICTALDNERFSSIDLQVKCSELVTAYNSMDTTYTMDMTVPETNNSKMMSDLYLIVRELYENASKHSKAKYVHIKINDNLGVVQLRYQDDGVGIQTEKSTTGIGMSSIRKRVSDLNGQIQLLKQQSGLGINILIPNPNLK